MFGRMATAGARSGGRTARGRLSLAASARLRGPADESLYEALRLWRLAEAKGQGIPPYVIFHDFGAARCRRPATADAG